MKYNCNEVMLDEIRAVNFAIVDLKLYLDTHPEEQSKINMYNNFVEKYRALVSEYQRDYSPICAEDYVSGHPWGWISNPWPWEYNERSGG